MLLLRLYCEICACAYCACSCTSVYSEYIAAHAIYVPLTYCTVDIRMQYYLEELSCDVMLLFIVCVPCDQLRLTPDRRGRKRLRAP